MKINKNILGFFLISIILLVVIFSYLKYKSAKNPQLVVINVLDKNLYDDCHIKGSINVLFENIEEYAKKLDKNTHVVLYCSNYMCTASGAAARIFKRNGFKNVWAYEAGMADWFYNKFPVEGKCTENYLNIQIEKPDFNEDEEIQPITTLELKDKIKKMLNIPGY